MNRVFVSPLQLQAQSECVGKSTSPPVLPSHLQQQQQQQKQTQQLQHHHKQRSSATSLTSSEQFIKPVFKEHQQENTSKPIKQPNNTTSTGQTSGNQHARMGDLLDQNARVFAGSLFSCVGIPFGSSKNSFYLPTKDDDMIHDSIDENFKSLNAAAAAATTSLMTSNTNNPSTAKNPKQITKKPRQTGHSRTLSTNLPATEPVHSSSSSSKALLGDMLSSNTTSMSYSQQQQQSHEPTGGFFFQRQKSSVEFASHKASNNNVSRRATAAQSSSQSQQSQRHMKSSDSISPDFTDAILGLIDRRSHVKQASLTTTSGFFKVPQQGSAVSIMPPPSPLSSQNKLQAFSRKASLNQIYPTTATTHIKWNSPPAASPLNHSNRSLQKVVTRTIVPASTPSTQQSSRQLGYFSGMNQTAKKPFYHPFAHAITSESFSKQSAVVNQLFLTNVSRYSQRNNNLFSRESQQSSLKENNPFGFEEEIGEKSQEYLASNNGSQQYDDLQKLQKNRVSSNPITVEQEMTEYFGSKNYLRRSKKQLGKYLHRKKNAIFEYGTTLLKGRSGKQQSQSQSKQDEVITTEESEVGKPVVAHVATEVVSSSPEKRKKDQQYILQEKKQAALFRGVKQGEMSGSIAKELLTRKAIEEDLDIVREKVKLQKYFLDESIPIAEKRANFKDIQQFYAPDSMHVDENIAREIYLYLTTLKGFFLKIDPILPQQAAQLRKYAEFFMPVSSSSSSAVNSLDHSQQMIQLPPPPPSNALLNAFAQVKKSQWANKTVALIDD